MSKGDFLPMKAEELQQRLPEINRRLMEGLILLPEELRELPVEGDYDDYVAHGERIIEHHMEHVEQIEMALGALLIAIRTKYGKEKWYEALGRLGISPRRAARWRSTAISRPRSAGLDRGGDRGSAGGISRAGVRAEPGGIRWRFRAIECGDVRRGTDAGRG